MRKEVILEDYPYLEPEDIEECLNYAAYGYTKTCEVLKTSQV